MPDTVAQQTSITMDWSGWMEADDAGRASMLRRYRERVRVDSENNAARWLRMTPAQRARYPEIAHA